MTTLDDLSNWASLVRLTISDLPGPSKYEYIYAFRLSSTKEIVYIGQTNNLRRRIFGNYIGGVGGQTTKRIHDILFEKGAIKDVEIAWKECLNSKRIESQLIRQYVEEHGKRPLWNLQL